jgi:hypothetical protein
MKWSLWRELALAELEGLPLHLPETTEEIQENF